MKVRLFKDFKKIKKIGGVNVNTLRALLEENQDRPGIVIIDGRTLGCVKTRYQIKCKSSNCFLIQKEIGENQIGHNYCHKCHLAFLNQFEDGKIKAKK